jgi:hypothetical protein
VWRGLKHKLTLYCASPKELQGKLWGVIGEFCPQVVEDINKKFNTGPEAVSLNTEHKDENAVSTQGGGPSVVTITLIVIGVLLACLLSGSIICLGVANGRKGRP